MPVSRARSLIFGSLAAFFAACSDAPKQAAPPPPSVNIDTVKEGSAVFFDQYPGTVTAVNEVEVRPQVSGYLTGIFFTEGQHVNKGQKLYQIDPQQYAGAYEQAVAQLNASKASEAKAQQDADRYQQLAQQDAIARQTVDHAMADLETAKKQVDASKANVSLVATNLKYSTIYAPYSGTIGISAVKPGASVSAGQTLLNTISSDDPIAVDFAPDQKYIPSLMRLKQGKDIAADSILTLAFNDGSVYPYPGKLFIIDRAVDPQTGTIKTRLTFPNPGKVLRAGMNCLVRIKTAAPASTLLIPYKSVVEQMGEFFVYVIGDSNKVSQRKVQLGNPVRGQVVVRDGLKPGDRIVTDGVQRLRDGLVVNPGKPGGDSSRTAKPDSAKAKP